MTQQEFGGDKKVGESVLGPWEKRFVKRHVERIPKFLETYHLTMLTVVWSGLVLLLFWTGSSRCFPRLKPSLRRVTG